MNRFNKSVLASVFIATSAFSAFTFAENNAKLIEQQQNQATLDKSVDKIATIGFSAMQDINLSRVSLFNGDISKAKDMLMSANKKLNDDQTDWSSFIKKNKNPPVDGDSYIVINSVLSIDENYQPTDVKHDAIQKANEKLKNGDKKGALGTLKLAGVSVTENQMLMPLNQTRKNVKDAIKLFDEGKYYQANLVLHSAEQGIIVDSEVENE